MKSSLKCGLFLVCFLFPVTFLFSTSNPDCKELISPNSNPFLNDDMFDNLDFSKIELSHYIPAVDAGIKEASDVVDNIINSKEEPNFENVIVPLEYGFKILDRVESLFFNLSSSISSKERKAIESVLIEKLSDFENSLSFNKKLFEKIKQVYDKKDSLNLSADALRVLELRYKAYVVEGIDLPEDKQELIKKINVQLSTLSTEFKNNLLEDTQNNYILEKDRSRLSGLSESVIKSFETAAKSRGLSGYLITASRTDTLNILTDADSRDLRKEAMELYTSLGKEKNVAIARQMINLRIDLANIMGKTNYADYILENYSMAKTAEVAQDFMNKVWEKALDKAKIEKQELEDFARIQLSDPTFKLESWDWFYWSEKLKAKICDLDSNELKNYFELSAVRQGLFTVLSKLYDLEFIKIEKSVYHPDVEVYRVQDSKTKELKGELYLDYFAREGKNAGAWSSRFRSQYIDENGNDVRPIVVNVFNFLKPADGEPVLLTIDNVTTLFHEVGHAIHSLLSKCFYPSLSTGFTRDFVELPSQILEKWAFHKDVLPLYARNYKTGELISQDLIDKMEKLEKYGKGFDKVEYLSAAILDMALHARSEKFKDDAELIDFEDSVLKSSGLIPEIVVRYKTPYFKHIFAGGYYVRYYAYLWAEVLVSDAFSFFTKEGVFNRKVADSFKNNVLSRGNSEDASILYEKFSGNKNPSTDALMKDLGFDE